MKRLLLLLSTLLLFCSLYAAPVSYTPSIAINGGMNITAFNDNVENAHRARINYTLGINADILSMTMFDQHRLSLPIAFSYDFKSEVVHYRFIQPKVSLAVLVEYGYQSNKLLGISIASGPRYDWYYMTNSANLALDNTLTLSIKPSKYFSLGFPITLSLSKLGYEVEARCAIKFYLDPFFKGGSK